MDIRKLKLSHVIQLNLSKAPRSSARLTWKRLLATILCGFQYNLSSDAWSRICMPNVNYYTLTTEELKNAFNLAISQCSESMEESLNTSLIVLLEKYAKNQYVTTSTICDFLMRTAEILEV